MAVKQNIYPPLQVELRPSTMLPGEIGLFAVRRIKGGAIIARSDVFQDDVFISWDDWKLIDVLTRRKLYAFCPGERDGLNAPPDLNSVPITWYINHSCDPNAGFDDHGNLVAIASIRGNTEITWDYSTLEYNPNFRMDCKCGSLNCRNIIVSKLADSLLKGQ